MKVRCYSSQRIRCRKLTRTLRLAIYSKLSVYEQSLYDSVTRAPQINTEFSIASPFSLIRAPSCPKAIVPSVFQLLSVLESSRMRRTSQRSSMVYAESAASHTVALQWRFMLAMLIIFRGLHLKELCVTHIQCVLYACVCVYMYIYKVVQIWPGQTVTCLHTNRPGHIWTTLYISYLWH